MSQASKDCVNRTETDFLTFGPGVGIEFGYKNDDLAFGFPNGLGPEVTAMKEAGVDFISTCIDLNSVLVLEQELERQGMSDVVVALPQGYADAEFISTNAALFEGDIMGVPYRPFEADPGDSDIQDDARRDRGQRHPAQRLRDAGLVQRHSSPPRASSPPARSSTGPASSPPPTRSPTGPPRA